MYSYWRLGEIRGGGERECKLLVRWYGGEAEPEGVVSVAEASRGVFVAGKTCWFCKGGQRVSGHMREYRGEVGNQERKET